MIPELNRLLAETLAVLDEKKTGILDLDFPQDCDQKDLLRAAEKDAVVKHGGNHDTVLDPETGQVITQIPRHDPKPGTCRAIIKDLKKAILKKRKEISPSTA